MMPRVHYCTRRRHLRPCTSKEKQKTVLAVSPIAIPSKAQPNSTLHNELDLRQRQIRILRLLPGNRRDPILCTLEIACLGENPDYEALSYAWGDPNICLPILVNGRTVNVTTNLEAALRRLRRRCYDRYLWVDALCINQANEREKTHQVNLMADVYSQTSQALIWLGEYAECHSVMPPLPGRRSQRITRSSSTKYQAPPKLPPESESHQTVALSRSECIAAHRLVLHLASGKHFHQRQNDKDDFMTASELSSSEDALNKLMTVDWWHRLWTIQEAVLPTQALFIYGTTRVPLHTFGKARAAFELHFVGKCCAFKDSLLGTFSDGYQSLIYMKSGPRDNDLFCTALNMFRSRKASDHRDRVFALLGLGSSLKADYSISVEAIYIRTIRHSIETSGDLVSLLRTFEMDRSPRLPQWVPDWRASPDTSRQSFNHQIGWYLVWLRYLAAGSSVATMKRSEHESALFLQGHLVGHVLAECGPSKSQESAISRRNKILRETSKKNGDVYPVSGGTYAAAFRRSYEADSVLVTENGSYHWRRATTDDKDENKMGLEELCNARAYELWIMLASFFSTNNGFIGLCNEYIKPGDAIFVLLGGRMPFVVRPKVITTNTEVQSVQYEYIGQAYVQGIMDGEFMEKQDQEPEWVKLI